MSLTEPAPFTFAILDGLCLAAARNRLTPLPDATFRLLDLGPILELARLSISGLLPAPSGANWLTLDDAAGFGAALGERRTVWTCRERHIGFLRMRPIRPEDEMEEIAFKLEAQRAAHAVGFPRTLAAQLVGAFEEIQGNVYDHSGASSSGLAAYRATARRFEFVVSDGGRGVLKSLCSCTDYAGLTDHGEALRMMLMDGVTRYGKGSNHGTGFRPLFQGLANIKGELRFRSGDCALTINGLNPGSIPASIAEKPPIEGFIASVSCSY